jgi:hypothetical protein
MGTSGSSGGPGSRTPLVPSWLNEPSDGPVPGGEGDTSPDAESPQPADGNAGDAPGHRQPLPPIPPAPPPARFREARRNFSAFAASGGHDHRALRRSVRDYVRSGAVGGRNATRRMGAARSAASGILGVFRGFQQDGIDATLRRLNLDDLVGRPPGDLFLGLTDVICQDGGPIDEGIARDAWLETVAELDGIGIADAAAITTAQMQDVFLAFVAHAIEARLFQDIGVNGLKITSELAAIEAFEAQLRGYIRRSVRDSFAGDLTALSTFTDRQIGAIVDRTYQDAWDLLVTLGDAEG